MEVSFIGVRCAAQNPAYFVANGAAKQSRPAIRVLLHSRIYANSLQPSSTIGAILTAGGQIGQNLQVTQTARAAKETAGRQTLRASRDALLQRAADEPDLTWRVLTTLNAFRALIAIALLVLFFAGGEPRVFGHESPSIFWITAAGYLLAALIFSFALRQRWFSADLQATFQALVDIAAVVILMHTSGGIASGLGGLLIVFVGSTSLLLTRQIPTVLAAVATFAILGQQAFSQLGSTTTEANYPAAGILSAVIFAIALATRPLGQRIQASEALARQRGVDLQNLSELNEYIVQHLRESIIVIDDANNIRLGNASATQLLGATSSVRGLPLHKVFEPLADYIREWRTDSDQSAHPEFTVITEGNNLRVTAHLAPLGKDGVRNGPVLVFLEDASLMNARVQQSKLASLGRLSASIAHEIRNPVGAMSHAAQLLGESSGLTDDDKRLTEIIESHSSRVSHIIDNVLQLSRRESGKPDRLALKPWLEDFAREFSRTLELQEGELSVEDIPDALEVRMDKSHLRQVLWNLCDNAVKYASETGGILVELHADRLEDQGRPYLEVRDHGLGVDPATAEQIFEPFFTARSGGGSIFRIVFADPDRWDKQE